MTNYEVTLLYLREMRDDEGFTLEESLDILSEQF